MGAWISDGCIYKSKDRPNRKIVTLTSKDKDWLESINQYICPEKPLLNHGKNCYRLMYNSTGLAEWFISNQCDSQKSLTVKFPNIPKKYLKDFIRGCWDGDGSLSFTKSGNKGKNYQRQANLTSGSLEFCNELSAVLNKLSIKNKVIPHGRHLRKIDGRILQPSNSWRVILTSGQSTYNLCKQIYENSSLSMPRKQNIAEAIIAEWEINHPVK